MADTAVRIRTTKAPTITALAGVAVAGVLSALTARWLSHDLMSPGWAVIGVLLFTGAAMWWVSRRSERRIDPIVLAVTLVMCGSVAWAAWVPGSLVLPQRELLDAVESHTTEASAQAGELWTQLGTGRCVPATEVSLGLVGDFGSWREVCTMGTAPGQEFVTYRPTNPHLLTVVSGPVAGIPGACARQIADGWWAVVDNVPGEPRRACDAGFTFQGQG